MMNKSVMQQIIPILPLHLSGINFNLPENLWAMSAYAETKKKQVPDVHG